MKLDLHYEYCECEYVCYTKYDIKVLGIMMWIILLYFLKRYVSSHNQLLKTDSAIYGN